MSGDLSVPEAVLLGLVEGLTEFLPVSSTGHLLFVNELVGLGARGNGAAADTFAVAIQFGAILAVLVLLRHRVASMLRGITGADAAGRGLLLAVITAFLPAGIVGALAGDRIKDVLFGPVPVVVAWAVGGVVLLAWRPAAGGRPLEDLGIHTAFIVGVAQVLAMWPGVSRSLVTILVAVLAGMSLAAALEFSFLLGLVTLSAATVLDGSRNGADLVSAFGWTAPLVGLVTAFLAAVAAVQWLQRRVSPGAFRVLGLYRLGAALVGLALLLSGTV